MAIIGMSNAIKHSYELKPAYPLQPWVVVLSAALFFFFEFHLISGYCRHPDLSVKEGIVLNSQTY